MDHWLRSGGGRSDGKNDRSAHARRHGSGGALEVRSQGVAGVTVLVRLTTLKDGASMTVRVEGGLNRGNVSQLVAEVVTAPAGVVLDLYGLRSADAAAVHVLQGLKAAGAVVEGASVYIAHLLETAERDPGDEPVDD